MPDWWDELLPIVPYAKKPGEEEMLRLIAYDIRDPRRLQRVAAVCEDFGVRVQYSLFECWLDEEAFQRLWSRLCREFKEDRDRLVAYTLDQAAAEKRITAGSDMLCTTKQSFYIA